MNEWADDSYGGGDHLLGDLPGAGQSTNGKAKNRAVSLQEALARYVALGEDPERAAELAEEEVERLEAGARSKRPAHVDSIEKHLTDVGNAHRIVERHGQDMLFVHQWKTWLVWDGKRWAEDVTGEAIRRVKETQAHHYQLVARQLVEPGDGSDDANQKLVVTSLNAKLKHLLSWENERRVKASLELARSDVPALPSDFDHDPHLLGVQNGVINLRTGELLPHDRKYRITKLANTVYDPQAKCDLWQSFLRRFMDGNQDLIDYLQKVVGYSLTGDVSEQCLWFLYGTGANGKTTFLTTIRNLLGDYAIQSVSDLLLEKKNESHPTERADLFGVRFVSTIETDQGRRMAEAFLKQATGGDSIRARKCHKDFFEFQPTHKLFLAANHKPVVKGQDHGIWRRVKLLPFTVTISEDDKDPHFMEKLRAEWPGILRWAVEGCLLWQKGGLGEPDEVRQATSEYRAEMDTVQGFLVDHCMLHKELKVRASLLLDAYHRWSGEKTMTQRELKKCLEANPDYSPVTLSSWRTREHSW